MRVLQNHEIHDEATPLFYYKCEGKLQKRVHMLPVHPGVQMSIGQGEHLDVPEAMKSFCNTLSIKTGEVRKMDGGKENDKEK